MSPAASAGDLRVEDAPVLRFVHSLLVDAPRRREALQHTAILDVRDGAVLSADDVGVLVAALKLHFEALPVSLVSIAALSHRVGVDVREAMNGWLCATLDLAVEEPGCSSWLRTAFVRTALVESGEHLDAVYQLHADLVTHVAAHLAGDTDVLGRRLDALLRGLQ